MGADSFLISIGLAGACYVLSAIFLLGAKRYVQGNVNVMYIFKLALPHF